MKITIKGIDIIENKDEAIRVCRDYFNGETENLSLECIADSIRENIDLKDESDESIALLDEICESEEFQEIVEYIGENI